MYLAMLFGMIWYSSMTMLSNTNLWFCLPKNDVYISGNLTEEIYKYVGENEYVKSIVYGDFSYVEEIKVVGHEELVNYLRFDTYNDFSYENTGIKIIEGREPTEINEVLLGEELISLLKLNVGDTIQLKLNNVSRVYEICGSFQTVADQGLKIMMSTKTVKDIIPDYVPKRGYIQLYDMNKYELALILNAKIEDEARAKVVEKVEEYIGRFGGTVTDVDEWGKRRLAYEIQKMREGFYYFIRFDAAPDCPAELERRLRIMDNVLRFLCVKQDPKVLQAEVEAAARAEAEVETEAE